jgi:hypothetical protein
VTSVDDRLDHVRLTADAAARAANEARAGVERISGEMVTMKKALGVALQGMPRQGAAPSDAESPVEWLTVADKVMAAQTLVGLHQWVRDVWCWHQPDLADCWPWHAVVVEELRAMWATWVQAVSEADKKPALMTTWLGPLRKSARTEVGEALKPCRGKHKDAVSSCDYRVVIAAGDTEMILTAVAEWWVETRGHSEGIPPGLARM